MTVITQPADIQGNDPAQAMLIYQFGSPLALRGFVTKEGAHLILAPVGYSPDATLIYAEVGGAPTFVVYGDGDTALMGTLSAGVNVVAEARVLVGNGSAGAPSLSFKTPGNGTTGIYNAGDNTKVMRFVTDGQNRLTIDAAGNVGIGTDTAAPGAKLEVRGVAHERISLDLHYCEYRRPNPRYILQGSSGGAKRQRASAWPNRLSRAMEHKRDADGR